jgi:hypothetical protein
MTNGRKYVVFHRNQDSIMEGKLFFAVQYCTLLLFFLQPIILKSRKKESLKWIPGKDKTQKKPLAVPYQL